MGWKHFGLGLGFCVAVAAPASASSIYVVRHASWTAADERDYGEFIAAIGASGCRSVDSCLHDRANPFAAGDPKGAEFRADCADLPYVLRFYYAWHRGLPFSYVADVAPAAAMPPTSAIRPGAMRPWRGATSSPAPMRWRRSTCCAMPCRSASYRIDPELEEPHESDFYSCRQG